MGARLDAAGVTTEVHADPEAPPVRANQKLQRVLFNLIDNAAHYTAGGSVVISAEATGAWVEVEVADSGEGIDDADREHVFDPFYRGGREWSRTRRGAGLGLTICRAIVEAHGGRIWVVEAAHGGHLRFSLPRA